MSRSRNRSRTEDGRPPTLTEYALVVLVMGAVGLVGVPRRQEAGERDQTPRLVRSLGLLRGAIEAYAEDHGEYPGYDVRQGGLSEANVQRHLTERTDELGHSPVNPWGPDPFGPYLWSLPVNPLNGRATIQVVGDHEPFPDAPDGRTGWIYRPATGDLRANVSGTLPGGEGRYYDL